MKRLMTENRIDISCVQETETEPNFTIDILSFNGFNYESETNETKLRVGIYISYHTHGEWMKTEQTLKLRN